MNVNNFSKKYYPAYFNELTHYPKSNPIFIATDSSSLKFIRRLNGICLFCEKAPTYYDFCFCYQREIWVLYSNVKYFPFAMRIAQATQLHGATKILVLQITVDKDNHYARY